MRTIPFKLPETLNMGDKEISMSLPAKLYDDGKVSLGQAAELAGLTKRAFLELLVQNGVFVFNSPASELSNDVNNATAINLKPVE